MTGLSIEAERFDSADRERELAAFLDRSADATIFHTPAWNRVIQATYRHHCDYWVARRGGGMVGIFPVTALRLPVLGTKMVAMPYQFHGGAPVSDDDSVRAALVGRAVAAARDRGAKYLEIRSDRPEPSLLDSGFQSVDAQLVVTNAEIEGIALGQIRRGHRRDVVHAGEQGVSIVEGQDLADLRVFQRLYLIESRRHGAPHAGWSWFANLHRWARSHYRLLLARTDAGAIGGLLTIDDGRGVFARCGAYNSPAASQVRAGKALLWRAISDAAQRGCRRFDLGISWRGDHGLIQSKEGWNGASRPVYQYVLPLRAPAPVPGTYFEGFKLAKAVWRRLPLPMVHWAGHQVTRWVA